MRNLAVVQLVILLCCPILLHSQGILWGTTTNGGTSSAGVIFQYDLASKTYAKKHDLNGTSDGFGPVGALCLAGNGKLYGVASTRGAYNKGVLFEYDISKATFATKIDFAGPNGDRPITGLTLAPNGKLYGTTRYGGAHGLGILFEYDPHSNTIVTKIDFNKSLGYHPRAALTLASNGKLYGTTQLGGSLTVDMGTLFEYDPLTNVHRILYRFEGGLDGAFPWASVTDGLDGKLYGTMPDGGTPDLGYVFSYDLSNGDLKRLHDFAGSPNGANPFGGRLSRVSNGKLYGLTNSGPQGQVAPGILYSYDPVANIYFKEYTFNSNQTVTSGVIDMFSGLVQVDNTKLYGMTKYGGMFFYGTLFEYDLAKKKYEQLVHFDRISGATPDNCSLIFIPTPATSQTITFNELPAKEITDVPFTLAATASSTLPVRFSTSNTSVATISNANVVTLVGTGTTTITAYQDGNTQYAPAPPVERQLVVTKADQEITFEMPGEKLLSDEPFELTATASSGLPIIYFSDNNSVATIDGSTLTIEAIGTATITATQPGNEKYESAPQKSHVLVVSLVTATESSLAAEMNVHPNPGSTILKIRLNNVNEEEIVAVRISDSQGRTLTNSNHRINNGELSVAIDQLAVGTYFIHCTHKSGAWHLRFQKN